MTTLITRLTDKPSKNTIRAFIYIGHGTVSFQQRNITNKKLVSDGDFMLEFQPFKSYDVDNIEENVLMVYP